MVWLRFSHLSWVMWINRTWQVARQTHVQTHAWSYGNPESDFLSLHLPSHLSVRNCSCVWVCFSTYSSSSPKDKGLSLSHRVENVELHIFYSRNWENRIFWCRQLDNHPFLFRGSLWCDLLVYLCCDFTNPIPNNPTFLPSHFSQVYFTQWRWSVVSGGGMICMIWWFYKIWNAMA